MNILNRVYFKAAHPNVSQAASPPPPLPVVGSGGVLSPCRLGSTPVGPVGTRVGGAGEGVSLLLTCAFHLP